jgi:hypothetical protein
VRIERIRLSAVLLGEQQRRLGRVGELAEVLVELLPDVVEDDAQHQRAVAARELVLGPPEHLAVVAVLALDEVAPAGLRTVTALRELGVGPGLR